MAKTTIKPKMWKRYFYLILLFFIVLYSCPALDTANATEEYNSLQVRQEMNRFSQVAGADTRAQTRQKITHLFEDGNEYYRAKFYEEAIATWYEVLLLNPMYKDKKDDEKAISLIKQAEGEMKPGKARAGELKEAPAKNTAEEFFNRWKELYENGEYSDSIPYIQKAMKQDPEFSAKAGDCIKKQRSAISLTRVEIDPVLKKKIEYEQKLLMEKKIKDVFDIFLTERFAYESNIHRTNTDRVGDYYFNTNPGIGVDIKDIKKGIDRLAVSYEYSQYEYLKHPKNSRDEHLVRFESRIPKLINLFGRYVKFDIMEYFRPGSYYSTTEQTQPRPVVYNQFNPEFEVQLTPKTSIALGYEHILQYYKQSEERQYSYETNVVKTELYYHKSPKISFFGGYEYGNIDYFESSLYPSYYNYVKAGFVGALTSKSSISVETGAQIRTYYDSNENKNTTKYLLDATYVNKISDKTSASIRLLRDIVESTYSTDAYYVENLLGLKVDYLVTKKVSAKLSLDTIYNQYPGKLFDSASGGYIQRYDWILVPRAGLTYKINNWLDCGVDYELNYRYSNTSTNAYLDNLFTTRATGRY